MSDNWVALLQGQMLKFHPHDAVTLLETMPTIEAINILKHQPADVTSDIWPVLSKDILHEIFMASPVLTQAHILESINPGDLWPLWSNLDPDRQQDVLTHMSARAKADIAKVHLYPEDSVGDVMDSYVVTLREDMTVAQALERIRRSGQRNWRAFYITDNFNQLIGSVDIADLALANPHTLVASLSEPVSDKLNAMATQEDYLSMLDSTDLKELPVVDDHHKFLGVVSTGQLLQATKEEATVDMQQMVGVSKGETALSSISYTVRKRLPWLQVNLLTAFMASSVVGLFEGTIAKYTALAVLLPVVAGQSGNTGAQALAVTIRSLALNEIGLSQSFRVIAKETSAAIINGIAIALTTALAVWFWSKDPGLGLIIGISMVISMILAAISGASVPLLLARLGQDPAAGSTIILTTITDIAGFFSFLGIATAFSWLL